MKAYLERHPEYDYLSPPERSYIPSRMKRLLLPLLALALCQPAAAATTRLDRHGTVVLHGRKVFPDRIGEGAAGRGDLPRSRQPA